LSRLVEQLPGLLIAVPLLSAPVCVLLRNARACWAWALLLTWLSLSASVTLLAETLATGRISYHVGDWEPPFGIELAVDPLNAFVLVIVTGVAAVVMSAAPRSLSAELPAAKHYLFFAAYLLCMTGLAGMTITGDAFNVFVFLEIASLSSYALVSLGRSPRALTAALQYLMLGTIGGTFILLGIGMLYMKTGSLNMADIAVRLQAAGADRVVLAGLAFLTVGSSIKLALFPLSIWLPNAYTYAPSIVTAFMAATSTKVALYVLLRFVFGVFGADMAIGELRLDAALLPLALLAMLVASTVAIWQSDVKRLLAYSSLAQVGYMVLGLAFASVDGLTGSIVHLFNHALMKSGLFLVIACFVLRVGSSQLADLRGIGRRMPLTTAAFVVCGLSLIGVPLTGGFVSKLYLVRAALDAGMWPVALIVLVSSVLAVVYVWRVVEVAYFQEAPAGAPSGEAPWSLLVPAWVFAGASLYFGIWTSASAGVARTAAAQLLGVAP
jgi:multicomponent Na+:H+ antiporter subunit D